MSTLSPDRWKAASPYLDQALEMPVEARAGWLETIRRQNPSLAADVEALLSEQQRMVGKGFLFAAVSRDDLLSTPRGRALLRVPLFQFRECPFASLHSLVEEFRLPR